MSDLIHFDASDELLTTYGVTNQVFLRDKPESDLVAVGAVVFSKQTKQPPRILLIKRAVGDGPAGGRWEIPGGGSDDSDPSILHAVARELLEESGLHMTAVVAKLPTEQDFRIRSGRRVKKLNFEVEVEEQEEGQVVTDPKEHSAYAWVSKEGMEGYTITSEDQRRVLVEAFELHETKR